MGGWALSWRRVPFDWEVGIRNGLLGVLRGFRGAEENDVWWSIPDEGRSFSVRSSYNKVLEERLLVEGGLTTMEEKVFDYIWKCSTRTKVIAFFWTLLLNRIPSKVNLTVRNVLPPDASLTCVLCNNGVETSYHLLLDCNVVSLLWRKVCVWLDLKCWSDVVRSKKFQRGYRMIWHAAIWVIRGERNGRIFNSIVKDIDDVVKAIELICVHFIFRFPV
jgi:hypothetical protein